MCFNETGIWGGETANECVIPYIMHLKVKHVQKVFLKIALSSSPSQTALSSPSHPALNSSPLHHTQLSVTLHQTQLSVTSS